MGMFHGSREIENGQQHENQRLHEGNQHPEAENRQGCEISASQHEQNGQQGFLGHDITEKSYGQGEETC